ncbi:MAG: lytic murein transglycosylase B [Mizugakiibacter sp.]|uniref:lytic murein transglycosylase B n=1 Tax=Mizugakiibacter sp. TaxID=1972610 RepID=UPI0031C3A5B7|nr:lytic murein transglycosylase B [Xanthomonadaceae bacterium]
MPWLIRVLPLLALFPAFALAAAEPAAESVPTEAHPGARAFAREVAQRRGLDEASILATLDAARYQQGIVDAISRPAEAKPWKDYRPIFLTDRRIADGVAFYRAHRELLERAAQDFGVAPEYVVAILGVETGYGRITGRYRVIDALATLAFHYPPRAAFFRGELEQLFALPPHRLPQPLDRLTGSYAGAMGWGQFMPSSIAAYARDYDGDGTIDLWNSLPDIVASVANYFAAHGWERGAPVAERVQRAADAQAVAADGVEPSFTMGRLESWGYAPFVHVDPARAATLLTLDGANGPEYWAIYRNFQVITRYNRSPLYAMAVYQLAQAIAAGAAQADLGR